MKRFIEGAITGIGDVVRLLADEVHDSGGAALVSLAPMAAIIPSAWALWTATGNALLAFAIEAVGFASAWVGVELWRRDGRARWAVGMIGAYVTVAMALIIGNKVAPVFVDPLSTSGQRTAAIASALMPLLAIIGAIIYALGRGLREEVKAARRAAEHQQAHDDARAEAELDVYRAREMAKTAKKYGTAVPEASQSGTKSGQRDNYGTVLSVWDKAPTASLRQVADDTGLSKSTVGRLRNELIAQGRISVDGKTITINGGV